MPRIISFDEALAELAEVRRHLLLGNGFSIALFPDRFRYGALLDEADFSGLPEARKAFDLLGTTDFEVVVEALKRAVELLPLYSSDKDATKKMAAHAENSKRSARSRHRGTPSRAPFSKSARHSTRLVVVFSQIS